MQIANRNIVFNTHGRDNEPQITVKQGEEFVVETELCSGGWLNSLTDVYSQDKRTGNNPCVCVAVEGAAPGSMLAVTILDIVPDKLGYTGFLGSRHALANRIRHFDWGDTYKTVEITDGFVIWDDKLRLPISPMIGVLGTAPAEEVILNSKGGAHGGNMDVQEVCTGNTIYLPVEVDAALLHIGDAHAIQGDGELNGAGGIECRATVRLKAEVLERPEDFRCVRIENEEYIMTVGCQRSIEESFHLATDQLIRWMEQDYGFSAADAFLLMGQVLEARVTQFVNPTFSYICKMPKKYL